MAAILLTRAMGTAMRKQIWVLAATSALLISQTSGATDAEEAMFRRGANKAVEEMLVCAAYYVIMGHVCEAQLGTGAEGCTVWEDEFREVMMWAVTFGEPIGQTQERIFGRLNVLTRDMLAGIDPKAPEPLRALESSYRDVCAYVLAHPHERVAWWVEREEQRQH